MEILDYEDLNDFIKAFKQRDESSCQHYIEKIYRYYQHNSRDLLFMDRDESEKAGYAFAIMALAYEWKDEIDKVVAENAFFILSHGYSKHNDPYVLPALFSLIEFDAHNLIDITTKVLMQIKRAGIPSSIPNNLVIMGNPIMDESWLQFRNDSMRILTPIKCYIIDQIYDIKEKRYRDLSMSFSHVQLSPLGTKGFWKAIESCQTIPYEVFLNICSIGKTNMDCMYNEIKRQIKLHSEISSIIDNNNEHTEPFFTIREFANLKGMPTNAGQLPLKDSEGNNFKAQGMSFGATFVTYSPQIIDEHPEDNAYNIAKYILTHSSDYEITQKTEWTTMNDNPVYVIYHV